MDGTLEELQAEVDRLRRLRMVGEFAGGLVHDFNNLLGSILAYVDLQCAAELPERDRRMTQHARESLVRATAMLQNVASYALRPARDRVWVSLRDLVVDALQIGSSVIKSVGCDVTLCDANDVEVRVKPADAKEWLVQTLLHALRTGRGGASCRVTVSAVDRDERSFGCVEFEFDEPATDVDDRLRGWLEHPGEGLGRLSGGAGATMRPLVEAAVAAHYAGGAFECASGDRRVFRILFAR